MEHVWEQGSCTSEDIHEITVHFEFDFSEGSLFSRNPFDSVCHMMREARKGLSFSMDAIMRVYPMLTTLCQVKDGFYAFMQFLTILYELSKCDGAHTLASSSYAKVEVTSDSRRVQKVKSYIEQNYKHEIRLKTLADIAGMSSSASVDSLSCTLVVILASISLTSDWVMPADF